MTTAKNPKSRRLLAIVATIVAAYLGISTVAALLIALSPLGGGTTAVPLLVVGGLAVVTGGMIFVAERLWRGSSPLRRRP